MPAYKNIYDPRWIGKITTKASTFLDSNFLINVDTYYQYGTPGNAADFSIGYMSSSDQLVIGVGSDLTTPALSFKVENGEPVLSGALKSDTGDPAGPDEGQLTINTFDNAIKIYADGAWRTLASW